MPNIISHASDSDILVLKRQGAPVILASLKTEIKIHKKNLVTKKPHVTTHHYKQLVEFIDKLCAFITALDVPYPANIFSAGFSYACNPAKHKKAGTEAVHQMTTRMVPGLIADIEVLETEDHGSLLTVVFKYFLALKLSEEERQRAVEKGDAGTADKMAYDILQKQEPRMDFRRLSDLLVAPIFDVLHKKLSVVIEKQRPPLPR